MVRPKLTNIAVVVLLALAFLATVEVRWRWAEQPEGIWLYPRVGHSATALVNQWSTTGIWMGTWLDVRDPGPCNLAVAVSASGVSVQCRLPSGEFWHGSIP